MLAKKVAKICRQTTENRMSLVYAGMLFASGRLAYRYLFFFTIETHLVFQTKKLGKQKHQRRCLDFYRFDIDFLLIARENGI